MSNFKMPYSWNKLGADLGAVLVTGRNYTVINSITGNAHTTLVVKDGWITVGDYSICSVEQIDNLVLALKMIQENERNN